MDHQNGNSTTYNVYHTTIFINSTGEENGLGAWKGHTPSIPGIIPAGADPLQPLLQLLVRAIAPAQIYRLRHPSGTSKRDEDHIHLLLIIPNRCTTPFTELEPVLEMAGINHKKLSCSLHQAGNVSEGLKKGHFFYTLAFRRENRIYDSGETVLPDVTHEALQSAKDHLQHTFAAYHNKATRFYHATEALLVHNDPLALFMLQQAAEMIFRGLLLALNGYDKKTHELRSLKKHLRRCAPQLLEIFPDNTGEETRLLTLLEDAYLQARYRQDFACSPDDAATLHQRVKALLDTAAQVKEQVVQSLEKPVAPGVFG